MKKIILILFLFIISTLSAEWTVVQTFPIPEGASGLAFDGSYLYCGIYGANGDEVYRIDPSDGSYQLQFTNINIGDSFGMTFDGSNLWVTDHVTSPSVPATAYELDINSGVILSQFDLPAHYMSGIAYDNGDFWVTAYYDPDGQVYKVDNSGNILQQFPAPDAQPWDLCLENDNLWIADYWGDALYKVDPTNGTLLETNSSEGVDPAGIVFDGQYLWYCDNGTGGNDLLYKVDLAGGGAPVIQIGWEEYDFGNTTVGQPSSVELPISNLGTADLTIDSMDFTLDDFYTDEILPISISPGETEDFSIFFDPSTCGNYDGTLQISSNDPVNPLEEVSLSGYGVVDGPHIIVTPTNVNYGDVRTGAVTGRFIEIVNQGDELLEVNEFVFDIDEYYLDDSFEFPLNIAPSENQQIRIWFHPETGNDFNGICSIHSNDVITPIIDITLDGSGDDTTYNIGQQLWQYNIDTGYDNSPKAITKISDVTNDGKNDVIITSEDNYVRCFNGNSDTSADIIWETEIYSGNVFGQNGLITVDDIDEDGYDDVIIGTGGGDRSVRCLSGKTGEIFFTFDTAIYGEGGVVYQVESSLDFNADGIEDVTAATGDDSYGTGPERIFLFDGSNGDVLWNFHTEGPKFSCLSVNDVNGDDIPDVIGGASNNYETTGIVYGIDGASGDQLWEFSAAGSSVWALETVDDINGDGIDDIVVGDFSGNIYALDAVDGDELWTASAGTCIILRFEKMDDVNGDGHPDIAVAHSSNSNALMIDGYDGSTIWLHSVADQPWVSDRIEDISGDGINDLIVGTLYNNNFAYFLDGADGTELASIPMNSPVDAIGGIADVASDDSWEMVVGGRDGTVKCISGGDLASSSNEYSIPYTSDIVDLFGNFPNPFNPETSINFDLKQNSKVTLQVFNIKGQLIQTLLNEQLPSSYYSIVWNGKNYNGHDVTSGVYLYKLQVDNHVLARKCILLK